MSLEQRDRRIQDILRRLDNLEAQSKINYDKGAFTPIYYGSATAGVTTYSLQQGAYRRLGTLIIATLTLVWTAATGTGNAQISLPFTSANVANQNYSGSVRNVNVTFANSTPQVLLLPNNDFFILQSPLTNAASTNVAVEAAGNLVATVMYFID